MLAKLGAVTAGLLLIGQSMVHAHDFSEAVAQARASGGGQAEEDVAKLDNEDHNGKISKEEFKDFISDYPQAKQVLSQMAHRNGNGVLTEQEANKFYKDNFDTNAGPPRNWSD